MYPKKISSEIMNAGVPLKPRFLAKSISFLSFDLYQKVFAEKKNSQVIIIDIDEKSLGKFGQFPWNRIVFA